MEDGFYEKLLQDVHAHMQEKNYQEAMLLLEEEFRMPYIPKEYEEKLIPLYNECKSVLNAHKKERKYEEDEIEELLNGSLDEAFCAVELLKASNIRKHLEGVETYLQNNPHFLIRSLLIECLIEQDIRDEIRLNYDGLEVRFTPSYVEMPNEQEAFMKAVKQVQQYYENDNPTFLMMCVECMMKEMFFKLPFSLTEDEMNHFIYAILLYVYQANGDLEGFKAFIHEKNLANYGGYDLLLYKYDI
ncbi:MAG: hypothetical protein EOM50_17195 [Erysipelotrichia bacterium]|nr:hypothetical protein [Erysipelotrichia bacterium]NCC54837.1 hypothetical protein [Erysipelotrichia bacterium]